MDRKTHFVIVLRSVRRALSHCYMMPDQDTCHLLRIPRAGFDGRRKTCFWSGGDRVGPGQCRFQFYAAVRKAAPSPYLPERRSGNPLISGSDVNWSRILREAKQPYFRSGRYLTAGHHLQRKSLRAWVSVYWSYLNDAAAAWRDFCSRHVSQGLDDQAGSNGIQTNSFSW